MSNAGVQIVAPLDQFEFAKWKKLLAIHLDGAFSPPDRRCARCTARDAAAASSTWAQCFEGGVETQSTPVTAKHGLVGLAKVVAKEGAEHGVRANVAPGFVRTPLVEQFRAGKGTRHYRGSGDQDCDAQRDRGRQFTTVADVAAVAVFFADFESNALTGQSLVVSHGWFMQ